MLSLVEHEKFLSGPELVGLKNLSMVCNLVDAETEKPFEKPS